MYFYNGHRISYNYLLYYTNDCIYFLLADARFEKNEYYIAEKQLVDRLILSFRATNQQQNLSKFLGNTLFLKISFKYFRDYKIDGE
jgi:hypothetical protein